MTKFALSAVWATVAAVALGMFGSAATAQPGGGGGGGNAAPQISNFASSNGYAELGTSIRFSWSVSDAEGDALTCTFDPTGVGPETTIPGCAGQQQIDYLYSTNGYFQPRITVSDGTSSVHADLQQVIHGSPIFVTLHTPGRSSLAEVPIVRDTQKVVIFLVTERDLVSATARIGTAQQALSLDPSECDPPVTCLSGMLDLSGLASGPYTLEVVAEDIDGVRAYAYMRVLLDRPPQLVVTSPIPNTVGRPFVRVTADCVDDTGGCTISARWDANPDLPPVLAPTPAPVDADVDISQTFQSGVHTLIFTARDASQQTSVISVPLHIDLSPQLTEIDSVGGTILSVLGRRILYVLEEAGGDRVFAFDRDVRVPVEIPLPSGRRVDGPTTQLTPSGAIVVARADAPNTGGLHRIYEWNGTTLTDLGQVYPAELSIAVAGDYAIWTYQGVLRRRDVSTGTTLVVASGVAVENRSVTPDGIVTYVPTSRTQVLRFDGSATTTIATATGMLRYANPISDGTTTLVRRRLSDDNSIVLIDAGGEQVLRPLGPGDVSQFTYDVRNGWYAYTLPNSLGYTQVWAAPIGGTPVRRTFGGTTAYGVTRIGTDGKILVSGRYMSTHDGDLLDLGGGTVQQLLPDGWQASIGRSLYSISGTSVLFDSGFEPAP